MAREALEEWWNLDHLEILKSRLEKLQPRADFGGGQGKEWRGWTRQSFEDLWKLLVSGLHDFTSWAVTVEYHTPFSTLSGVHDSSLVVPDQDAPVDKVTTPRHCMQWEHTISLFCLSSQLPEWLMWMLQNHFSQNKQISKDLFELCVC